MRILTAIFRGPPLRRTLASYAALALPLRRTLSYPSSPVRSAAAASTSEALAKARNVLEASKVAALKTDSLYMPSLTLYDNVMEHASSSAFYTHAGPISQTFRSTQEICFLHLWMVKRQLAALGQGERLWQSVCDRMWEDVRLRALPALGVSQHSVPGMLEDMEAMFEERLLQLDEALDQFEKSDNKDMSHFHDIVWNAIYARQERIDFKHVETFAEYAVFALRELDDVGKRRLLSGRVSWSTPVAHTRLVDHVQAAENSLFK